MRSSRRIARREASKVTVSGESLELLSADQRELLALLLEQEGGDLAKQPILPRPPGQAVPATPAQRRFWLLDRLVRRHGLRDPSLNVNVWQLHGQLDVDSLSRAFTELVRRHEALRSGLRVEDGRLVQVVPDAPPEVLEVIATDDRATSEEVARRIGSLIQRETSESFDLSMGPLLRAALLPLAADRHLLVLTTHYVAADGLSEGSLLAELGSLYTSLAQGEDLPAVASTLQYADFAHWQHRWIDSLRDAQLSFWRQQLRGSPGELLLPVDRQRPRLPTFEGATQAFTIDAQVAERLRTAARNQGATLYMMLLAALQAQLHRYSGQHDVIVGTTVSDRPRPEAEPLLGSFSNNLFLRAKVSSEAPLSQLLAQVRSTAAAAYAHQSLPTEDLVTALEADPDFDETPQLRAMFVLHYHSLDDDLRLRELVVQRVPIERGTSTFDFYVRMASAGDALSGSIEYSTDVFDAATIDQIIDDFQGLLAAIADDVERPVGELGMRPRQQVGGPSGIRRGDGGADARVACSRRLDDPSSDGALPDHPAAGGLRVEVAGRLPEIVP